VDSRTLRLLELDKILARLEEATTCSLGRARVRALKPSSALNEVRHRLTETTEARRFVQSGHHPPFGGISDIGLYLRNAAIGSMLDPAALLAVSQFASGARRLREIIIKTPRAEYPILHGHATRITPRPDIEKAISDAIDEATKEIKDDASLALLRARRNIRQTQNNVQTRLRQMLADHGKAARGYPDVRANTVPSFALGDYEWILAFEADQLDRIVDLMRHLRATEARRHVREEVPFYTGPRVAPGDLVATLP